MTPREEFIEDLIKLQAKGDSKMLAWYASVQSGTGRWSEPLIELDKEWNELFYGFIANWAPKNE